MPAQLSTSWHRRILVQCMECGKRFRTSNLLPQCPKCNGADIEPAEG